MAWFRTTSNSNGRPSCGAQPVHCVNYVWYHLPDGHDLDIGYTFGIRPVATCQSHGYVPHSTLLVQKKVHQKAGKTEAGDQYLGFTAILIESYALETAWNIAFCIFCSLKYVPVDNFFDATLTQVDVSQSFFIILSLALVHPCFLKRFL
jgi:hypothetical protein